MSWRYLQSTFPTLSGRSTLCPSCASKQRRSLGSTTANDIDLRQKISGNTAPSNSHQSQEVKEESSPVRIRFHRAQSVLTRPLHMGRAKVKHRRGPKVIKHPSRVIDHPFQLAVKDTGASSKTAVPRLHRLVPWGSAAPSIKYHPSGVDFAAQIDEQYAPDPQCRSVRIQKGLGHGTAAGPELALTLSLWDKQRHSQKDPVSDGNRRAFSSLAACASTKWASPKDLLGATAHHRSLYCASSTPHCSPLRPARLEPQRQGNGKRLLSSTTSHQAVVEALHTASSDISKTTKLNSANVHQESNIIGRLRLWQEEHQFDPVEMLAELPDSGQPGEVQNLLTRPQTSDQLIDADTTSLDDGLNYMRISDNGQLVDLESGRPFLRRGDLIEMHGGAGTRQPVLAIFIRDFESQSQFYTMQGQWVHQLRKSIRFSVPGFLDRTSVDEILPYLPPDEVSEELADKLHGFDTTVPREVGSSLVRKMLDFWNASDVAYRQHATKLDNVHDLVAHESDTRFSTSSEIAARVFGTPSDGRLHPYPILYAVHRALMQKDFGFVTDKLNHRKSGIFEVRPKREVRLITKVRGWIRDYQELIVASANQSNASPTSSRPSKGSPIIDFVNKARGLIIQSRRTRPTRAPGGLGPSIVKLDPQTTEAHSLFQMVSSESFSDNDKSIIRFLEAWACYSVFSRYSVMNSLGSMVLRATGLYGDRELDKSTCYLFLQEIGIIAPWENRTVFDTQLALPGHALSPGLDELHRKSMEPETRLSLRDLKDTMQDFRHDWEHLEVFCIDDEDAKEIDDGVSVEKVAGSHSEHWVHIHVANPSAFIDPDHFIAGYAAHLGESIYFPERTYPMLPKAWTQARLSLAPHRPVLTFSARLNGEGEILEHKVSSGIIRNVTYVTPSTLKQHLGGQLDPGRTTIITVGGQVPTRHTRDLQNTMSKAQVEQLQILQAMGNARCKVRKGKGAMLADTGATLDASVYGGPYGMPIRLPSHSRSRFYEGDPVIQLRADKFDPVGKSAGFSGLSGDTFVANLMILASEVAARWCKDRNLPVIYRCTLPNPDLQDPTTFVRDHVWPSSDEYGNTPLSVALQYIKLIGRAMASTTPMPHMTLGVESYTKVTSPMRRYGDLVVHWQIEAALRQEARTGASQVGKNDDSYLPFSKARLDSLLPGIESRERMVKAAQMYSTRHWVVQLFFRAHYFKEATLPETFEMYVYSGRRGILGYGTISVTGVLRDVAIDVEMQASALTEAAGLNIGDWWEVKLARIDTYSRKINVEPVRLISQAERLMGQVTASA